MMPSSLTMHESQAVRRIWESLGLPGIVDVHTHVLLTELDRFDDGWLRGVLHDNAARLFGLAHS
jgi:hypothetical protein